MEKLEKLDTTMGRLVDLAFRMEKQEKLDASGGQVVPSFSTFSRETLAVLAFHMEKLEKLDPSMGRLGTPWLF